jgi:hypothetical protein
MTRGTLHSRLKGTFFFLGIVLLIAALARFAYPFMDQAMPQGKVVFAVYEYLKDMALLIATGGVAYLANVFQQRSSFIDRLKEEWRDILHAKSALLEFTHIETPSTQQYVAAFNILSETIDNMRTVYRNVGETPELVGLYPYEPLHDMRRALQTLNPRKPAGITEEDRKLVRDAMLQSFYALRERFLEELDLEEPASPVVYYGSRRRKRTGATPRAIRLQERQRKQQDAKASSDPAIDDLLSRLKDKEAASPKPWRDASLAPSTQGQGAA